ncbi:lysozyme [Ketogulonicigenium vulgare]|uniref:lysozyme n=1 Tax=Ketogulonicigenium vulgare TaxID=92945 RepID=UPI002358B73A|nr:lysozyme [Ketogulonicigenium vulgare]
MQKILASLFAWLQSLFSTPKRAAATSGGAAAGLLTAIAVFVGPWEGERLEAYLDRIADPPVWTVCFGETRGVQQGDSYTSAECQQMLIEALAGYHAGLSRCVAALPDQPQGVQVALTSWAYNVGVGAACGSTLVRLANADDWRAACQQLPRWNRAGGQPVAGLTNRRAAEQRLCLNALEG